MCFNIDNPYCTHREWPDAVRAAYADMPVDATGHIAPVHEQYRHAWKQWFKRTPRELWHPFVLQGFQRLDRTPTRV